MCKKTSEDPIYDYKNQKKKHFCIYKHILLSVCVFAYSEKRKTKKRESTIKNRNRVVCAIKKNKTSLTKTHTQISIDHFSLIIIFMNQHLQQPPVVVHSLSMNYLKRLSSYYHYYYFHHHYYYYYCPCPNLLPMVKFGVAEKSLKKLINKIIKPFHVPLHYRDALATMMMPLLCRLFHLNQKIKSNKIQKINNSRCPPTSFNAPLPPVANFDNASLLAVDAKK
jgi:hypothetical protein